MKKIIAIVLILQFLFNIGGYALVFNYLIYRSDSSISEQINNSSFKPAELVEIKIPVHLNIQDWVEYKPVTGQVKVANVSYTYSELRMTRDTLYMKCIPNHDKARLVDAKTNYNKQVNDLPVSKKSNAPLSKKSTDENYYRYYTLQYHALPQVIKKEAGYSNVPADILTALIDIPGQPPEGIVC
ncbi:MAG: hypothetical protein ABIN95_09475 [Mucilaginibacter sp.]